MPPREVIPHVSATVSCEQTDAVTAARESGDAVAHDSAFLQRMRAALNCDSDDALPDARKQCREGSEAECSRLRKCCDAAARSVDDEIDAAICELSEKLVGAEALFTGFMQLLTGSHVEIEFPLPDEK
jgi:hypothetical protein